MAPVADEREQLEALIREGKSPAQRLLKARICGTPMSRKPATAGVNSGIIKTLEASASMAYRVRIGREP